MGNENNNLELLRILKNVTRLIERNKYAYIVPEHLLWGCLQEERFQQLAKSCGAKLDVVRSKVDEFLDGLERVEDESDIVPTKEYTKTIKNCSYLADKRFSEVRVEHIVLALLDLGESSDAAYILGEAGFTAELVEKFMSGELGGGVAKFAVEMVGRAREDRYDRLVGRGQELERIVQILHKKRSCNPLLLANPGVGKSAIVEGLAKRIAEGNVPESLKGATLWSLNLGSMIAGTKFRGEFEERLKETIESVTKDENAIVFIDEIHSIVGTGSSADGAMDASNILKPYLTDRSFRCIGATTYDEYRKHILKDKALARRFKKIDVAEPSHEETVEILKGLRDSYQEFHGVSFPDDVLESIVALCGQYLTEQYFPDKAIEVMDEIGSRYHSGACSGETATVHDVEELVARLANIPSVKVKDDGREALRNLEENVKAELYGQDEIVEKVTRHIKTAKAGLTSKTKPLGVFALLGQTGCGKTELVKQIARNMDCAFLKFDMSEYSEKGSVAKLVGTSPGYVGFEQAGALTEAVFRNPNSVILFDELEKADPAIYNLLLQVMDEGRLTDNTNRTALFNNTVIFMTGNVGSAAAETARNSIGFGGGESNAGKVLDESLAREFPPEFRNRFTDILRFNPLDRKAFAMIVDKEIRKLNEKLAERSLVVSLSSPAKEFIIDEAMGEKMGGRPVERLVGKHIAEKLVDAILFDDLKDKSLLFQKKGDTLESKAVATGRP